MARHSFLDMPLGIRALGQFDALGALAWLDVHDAEPTGGRVLAPPAQAVKDRKVVALDEVRHLSPR